MIPAVFDGMVFLQAAGSRKGPAAACLTLVEQQHVKLFVSAEILEEVRDILHRPSVRKNFPKLTDEVADEFVEHLIDISHAVDQVPAAYRLGRDPDDEPYLNLAIAAKAAFVVSRDKDILDLMNDDAFVKAYPDLKVVDPPTFASHVRSEIAKTTGTN
ncbi:MAG: putative toxin-antitoxin system toxin component, PIN family [Planctomycetes bacterium]|nr:putative toxin-antitoxin system toxin component, PIN family [Planctomycetota bacterium]